MLHDKQKVCGTGRLGCVALVAMSLWVVSAWGAGKQEELNPSEPAEAYFALVRGDTAREKGDFAAAFKAYEDALARYERIAQVHPDWESDIVQYRIVYCRQQMADVQKQLPAAPEEGVSDMSDASDLSDLSDASDASDQSDAAMDYLRNRIAELLQQVEELEEALEKQAEESDVASLQAELEETRKRAEAAEARSNELEKEVQRLSRTLAERADRTVSGKTSEADAQYVAIVREALKRERSKDWRGALALYEQARKRKSADQRSVLGQARCLMALGQLDKALAILEKQNDAGNDPSSAALRASALGMLGRYSEAAAVLEPFWRDGTFDPWICNLLGAAWLALGRSDEAREVLEKAVELAPDFAEPHYNLAVWYVKTGHDVAKAREQYQKSVELGGLTEPDFEALLSGEK